MCANSEQYIQKAHWCGIGNAERRLNRCEEALVSQAREGRDECIRDSHAIGSIRSSLLHSFNRLPQSATETDRNHQVLFPEIANGMRRLARSSGA